MQHLVHPKVLPTTTEAESYLPFLLSYIKLENVKTCFLKPVITLWLHITLQYSCYQGKFMERLQLTLPGKEMLCTLHPA